MTYLSIIALPSGFVASTTATATEFFVDLAPITILVIGILITTMVLGFLISFIRG